MQLKNVGVIVVILVSRHDTFTVRKEGRIIFFHNFSQHTHMHLHTCCSFLIVPLMR